MAAAGFKRHSDVQFRRECSLKTSEMLLQSIQSQMWNISTWSLWLPNIKAFHCLTLRWWCIKTRQCYGWLCRCSYVNIRSLLATKLQINDAMHVCDYQQRGSFTVWLCKRLLNSFCCHVAFHLTKSECLLLSAHISQGTTVFACIFLPFSFVSWPEQLL